MKLTKHDGKPVTMTSLEMVDYIKTVCAEAASLFIDATRHPISAAISAAVSR